MGIFRVAGLGGAAAACFLTLAAAGWSVPPTSDLPFFDIPRILGPAPDETPTTALSVVTDGAGYEARDAASGGAAAADFLHLESPSVCGNSCRLSGAGDDVVWGLVAPSGEPDFPFRWSSAIATIGRAGGAASEAVVFLDTNGYVAFAHPGSSYIPAAAALPNAGAPSGLVAGNWQDLNPGAAGGGNGIFTGIAGTAPNRTLYIEFWNVPHYGTSCTQQFEFILRESDYSVDVVYLSACQNGAWVAKGGEENSDGTAGITHFLGGDRVPTNTGVTYRDATPPAVVLDVACAAPGDAGWCRSSTARATASDNDDFGATSRGIGVRTRAFSIDGGAPAPYASGIVRTLTLAEGAHGLAASASDHAGNVGSATATVRIDSAPPVLTPRGDETSEAAGPAGAVVSYELPAASDATSGPREVACAPASGSTFPLGETLVSCSVLDDAGNAASTSFRVFVADTTAPTIDPTQDILVATSNAQGATVQYEPPATHDLVDGEGVAACSPGPGAVFPQGDTRVECTARDSAGNTATSSFLVRVSGALTRIDVLGPEAAFVGETVLFELRGFDAAGSPVTLSREMLPFVGFAAGPAQVCHAERGVAGCADVLVVEHRPRVDPYTVYLTEEGRFLAGLPAGGVGDVAPVPEPINFRRFRFAAQDCHRDLRIGLEFEPAATSLAADDVSVGVLNEFEARLLDAATGVELPNGTLAWLTPGARPYLLDRGREVQVDLSMRRGIDVNWTLRVAAWAASGAECEHVGGLLVNEIEGNPTPGGFETVEIANVGWTSVDIGGWTLRTTEGTVRSVVIPAGSSIPPGGHLVVPLLPRFLEDTRFGLALVAPRGWEIDRSPPQADAAADGRTWQRILDGAQWWVFRSGTLGAANGGR